MSKRAQERDGKSITELLFPKEENPAPSIEISPLAGGFSAGLVATLTQQSTLNFGMNTLLYGLGGSRLTNSIQPLVCPCCGWKLS